MIKKIIKDINSSNLSGKMNKGRKKPRFGIYSDEGYVNFEGLPEERISDDEHYMTFTTQKDASDYIENLKKKYDNKWADSLTINDLTDMFD